MPMVPDWVSYDDATEVLTIDGIKFDRRFFQFLGQDEMGTVGRIVRRENGVVTVQKIETKEAANGS